MGRRRFRDFVGARTLVPMSRDTGQPPDEPIARPRALRWAGWLTLAATVVLVSVLVVPAWVGHGRRALGDPSPSRTSSSPTPSRRAGNGDPFDAGPLVAGPGDRLISGGQVFEDPSNGRGLQFCVGNIAAKYPPTCTGWTTRGLTWAHVESRGVDVTTDRGVRWAQAVLVGTLQDETFTVEQVYPDDDSAPWPPGRDMGGGFNFNAFCAPARTTVERGSATAAQRAAESRPDYQMLYVDGSIINVVVTEDVEGAREAIEKVYLGPLCVGLGRGLTHRRLAQAQAAVTALMTPSSGINAVGIRPEGQGAALEVSVDLLTQDLYDQIVGAVGPDVAQWLVIRPRMLPIP
ncbi:hypothetical protein AESSP_00956 [Aestuariimicrobium sp. T2.26MG-19.2B]|nr:hypothetical protein AESSP_00956 [Aestuariimicrobium sp. T2.26MG-19.2B]